MPEAAINKNSEAIFAKNKVGFAGEPLIAAPACDFELAEYAYEAQFGFCVTL